MDILCNQRYLNLPVRNGAPKRAVTLTVNGVLRRKFEIELAEADAGFWTQLDLAPFSGQTVTLSITPPCERPGTLQLSDAPLGGKSFYLENALEDGRRIARPAYHFTAKRGWLNDPNGLVFYDGEYHLYFQHNPFGTAWGNMHWGHAISGDLVHWTELGDALHMAEHAREMCFSGSAIVDEHNTAGFQDGPHKTLLAFFTDTGLGECLTYSNDRGRTWSLYDSNPVVAHKGRDPKVIWFARSDKPDDGHWVMALYDEDEGGQDIIMLTSHDLKHWTFASRIKDFYECPDLIRLPVDGNQAHTRWVLYAADGRYLTGAFDGFVFTPDGPRQQLWHGNFYAAQTYSNAPGGRCIQVGWARGVTFGALPFNQQMNVPVELSLRSTSEGLRLCASAVPELQSLRAWQRDWSAVTLAADQALSTDVSEAGPQTPGHELRTSIELGTAHSVTMSLLGLTISYDVATETLHCGEVSAPLALADKRLTLHVLHDTGSLEIFAGDGMLADRAALSVAARPVLNDHVLSVTAHGGAARLSSLALYGLRSCWTQ
jgi:fructan beta-fructosidase